MTTIKPSPRIAALPDRTRAVLALVLTASLWSTSGVLIKVLDWQPMSILCGRSIFAIFVFLIYLRGTRLRITWMHVLGAAAFLVTQILYISATKMTTAANAIFLQYTAPIYVILLSAWWLKERPERADWLVLAVILAGMGCFFGERLSFTGLAGNVLALVSGATMALMNMTMRKISIGSDGNTAQGQTILLSFIAGSLVGLPSMVHESFAPRNVAMIVFLGIFQIGLAFALYASAMRHVRALEATLILGLEPILNPIWVFLAIGETPGPVALLGCTLVIGAVALRAVLSARAA